MPSCFSASSLITYGTALICCGFATWSLQVAKPQQISAVPYVIKLLAEKQEGIQALARPQLH
jgi:hypothetical protein